jgi:TonB family protein
MDFEVLAIVADRSLGTGRIILSSDFSLRVDGVSRGHLFEFTHSRLSRRPVAVSIVAHGLVLVLMFAIRFSGHIARVPVVERHLVYLAPAIKPHRTPVFHPRPVLPAVEIIPAPAIEAAKVVLPEIPVREMAPVVLPAPPKPVVKASGFENTEAPATRVAHGNLPTSLGSFDSAQVEAAAVGSTKATTRAGGFSDASASSFRPGGGSVTRGAFGDTTVEKGVAIQRRTAAAAFTPVEILSKPRPAYTEEARVKKIEGEVLLSMQFSASGEARVERVMRGLGYGLDETAMTAARGIRFRPATRDGGAVDSDAVVHILFQLAQ